MALVDAILARYEMEWKLYPYRIVNKYGVIVQKKHFDLREKTLNSQKELGFNPLKFKKTCPSTLKKIK